MGFLRAVQTGEPRSYPPAVGRGKREDTASASHQLGFADPVRARLAIAGGGAGLADTADQGDRAGLRRQLHRSRGARGVRSRSRRRSASPSSSNIASAPAARSARPRSPRPSPMATRFSSIPLPSRSWRAPCSTPAMTPARILPRSLPWQTCPWCWSRRRNTGPSPTSSPPERRAPARSTTPRSATARPPTSSPSGSASPPASPRSTFHSRARRKASPRSWRGASTSSFSPIGTAGPLIEGGKLSALAVSTRHRARALPDVPTSIEAGFPNSDFDFWIGLFLPAKTPRADRRKACPRDREGGAVARRAGATRDPRRRAHDDGGRPSSTPTCTRRSKRRAS